MKNTIHNKLGLRFLILSIFFSLPIFTIGQSCFEGNPDIGPQTTVNHVSAGSSFTACDDGDIISIMIYFNNLPTHGQDLLLTLYDGSDFTAPVLHTQIIPYSSLIIGANNITIPTPVLILSGEVNYFEVTRNDIPQTLGSVDGWAWEESDIYPGGRPIWSQNFPFLTFDLRFEIEIEINRPIPTLSQWTIIALGMIMLILGVVALKDFISFRLQGKKLEIGK